MYVAVNMIEANTSRTPGNVHRLVKLDIATGEVVKALTVRGQAPHTDLEFVAQVPALQLPRGSCVM